MDENSNEPVRFAVIGDVEPKPDPVFDHLRTAVRSINRMHDRAPFDFVAGIGDIPHRAKDIQYEIATSILRSLEPPFYPILGNEELDGGTGAIDQFLSYVTVWNDDGTHIDDVSYVRRFGGVRFVFASAQNDGRNFTDRELDWLETVVSADPHAPVVAFMHASPHPAFRKPQRASVRDRVMQFLEHGPVRAVFSGHGHMGIDHMETIAHGPANVVHIHVPGIERTKTGTSHVPHLRVGTVDAAGHLTVRTLNLATDAFEDRYEIEVTPDAES